jgi:hypothetical protein
LLCVTNGFRLILYWEREEWALSAEKMDTEKEEKWKNGKMEERALSTERVRRWELSTVKMSTVKMSTETKDRQKTEDGRRMERWALSTGHWDGKMERLEY